MKSAVLTETQVVLSFDVEEHFRIESAAGLAIDAATRAKYSARLQPTTDWLLDQLAEHDIRATFFVLGEVARDHRELVRAIARAGHEVASHGWDHRRVHHFDADSFRDDVRRSLDVIEQVTGQAVVGYRAPTFSIGVQTAWAIDVLAELDLLYDSSVYPVRHDRYGVPAAPRSPFMIRGRHRTILELPPATWRVLGVNIPAGGGGYFRLLPLFVTERAVRQVQGACHPPVATLYFHPWEFDPDQPRLPLSWTNRYRTYVGLSRSRDRLHALLGRHHFITAQEAAKRLSDDSAALPTFNLVETLYT